MTDHKDRGGVSPPIDELEAAISAASRHLDDTAGPATAPKPPADDEVLFCANHPTVETMLRCNRCSKPICTRCAVRTPVGYRCRACVNQQQAVFYTGGPLDSVIGGLIALILGGLAAMLMTSLGAWFFALILGPAIGMGIAATAQAAVRRRRSRTLWLAVVVGIVIAALPALFLSPSLSVWRLITLGLYLVLAAGAAAARLR